MDSNAWRNKPVWSECPRVWATWAMKRGDMSIVEQILAFTDLTASDATNIAAENGCTGALEHLLARKGGNSDADLERVLESAAESGHVDAVRLLLTHPGLGTAAFGPGPLLFAALGGHADVVDVLLADSRITSYVKYANIVRCIEIDGDADMAERLNRAAPTPAAE